MIIEKCVITKIVILLLCPIVSVVRGDPTKLYNSNKPVQCYIP